MRFLFVLPQYLPHVGGTEINLGRLMAALQADGHEVELVTTRKQRDWPAHELINGVPVTRVGGVFRHGRLRLGYGLSAVLFANAARRLRPHVARADLVFCSSMHPLCGIAAYLARRARKPAVIRIATTGPAPGEPGSDERHDTRLLAGTLDPALPALRVPAGSWVGSDIDHLAATYPRLTGPLRRFFRRPGTHFIALTALMRDWLRRQGIAPERITIIPNGLDRAEVAAPRRDDPARPPTALVVARHSFEKGVDVALHAWRIVQAALPAARLVLCGDGPLRANYAEMARLLGITDSVDFRGAVKDIPAVMAAADCFILPSRWEGFPVALLEACVAGLPAVATQVSGVSDLLIAGHTGYSVPVEDYEGMAARVIALLRDRDLARRLGQAAADHARATFRQTDAVARVVALAHRLAGETAPREEARP